MTYDPNTDDWIPGTTTHRQVREGLRDALQRRLRIDAQAVPGWINTTQYDLANGDIVKDGAKLYRPRAVSPQPTVGLSPSGNPGQWEEVGTQVSADAGQLLESAPGDGRPLLLAERKTLVCRQEVGAGNYFIDLGDLASANAGSSNPSSESKYSILGTLESRRRANGKIRFLLRYVDLGIEVIWEQASNPMTANPNAVEGFELLSATGLPNNDPDPLFGGLSPNGNGSATTLLQGWPENDLFIWTVGALAAAGGSIPATGFPTQTLSSVIELYVFEDTDLGRVYSDTAQAAVASARRAKRSTGYREEVYLCIGQSNYGSDSGPVLHDGLDAVHPRVFELSQGVAKAYPVPPAGQLMPFRPPGQNDAQGTSYTHTFAKHRADRHPEIQKVIVINRAVGNTGFSGNNWNPGDPEYTAAVDDLKATLAAHPDSVFAGILWLQGESAGAMTQSAYEGALAAMVEAIRDEARNVAPGRVEGVLALGTMVQSWIDQTPSLAQIDLAHRRVAQYIDNAALVDLSGLVDLQDRIHFSTRSLREMGRLYSEQVECLLTASLPSHRVRVAGGKVKDLFGGGGLVFDVQPSNLADDPIRGQVLDTNNTGLATGLTVNATEYTVSCWVNPQATPALVGNLLSGGQRFWGWGGGGHGASFALEPLANHLALSRWDHVTLSWDGANARTYVNGSLVATNALATPIDHPVGLFIGTFTTLGSANEVLDCLVDDIVVLPYALSDAGALALFNLVDSPVSPVDPGNGFVYSGERQGATTTQDSFLVDAGTYLLTSTIRSESAGGTAIVSIGTTAGSGDVYDNASEPLESGRRIARKLLTLTAGLKHIQHSVGGGTTDVTDWVTTIQKVGS